MILSKKFLIAPLMHLSTLWQMEIDWAAYEQLDKLEYIQETFNTSLARRLDLKALLDLQNIYNDAVQFSISIGDLKVLHLNPSITLSDLKEFHKSISGSPNLRLVLQIDKKKLAEIYFTEILSKISKEKEFFLYIFSQRFEQFINNCTLEDLETYLWNKNPKAKVLILLPEINMHLEGPRLLILGGKFLSPKFALMIFKTEEKFADNAYKVCRDNLKWQEAWLKFLTPWHLYIRGEAIKSCKIKNIMFFHYYNSTLLFTADQTFIQTLERQNRISRYRSPNKQVDISHASTGMNLDLTDDHLENVNWILEWIYDPQWKSFNDRLTLAQENIIYTICSLPENERGIGLFKKAFEIKKNIIWHWETFTQKKIEAYFGVIKDYENYLYQVVQTFNSDIAAIQKTLSDTVIAAIAVTIASFITYLFKDTFNPFIFRIGMTAYAIYILSVPLLYNMILQWKKYITCQEQCDARKNRLKENLPETKIMEIWDDCKVEATSNFFKKVFWVTIVIYIFVCILLLLIAWLVPPEVISSSVKS